MRIRKHVAKMLTSLSIPAGSCAAPPAAAAAATAAAGRELEMHVCELNQSPWDAMDFSALPETVPLQHFQVVPQELEEAHGENSVVGGSTWSGHREEEPAAAVSDVSGITAAQFTLRRHVKIEEMARGGEEEDDKGERKMEAPPKSSNASNHTKKIRRRSASACSGVRGSEVEMVKMAVESGTAAATAVTCKKSDGRGWHCKREAQHPHSLCQYHLTQVRSYYSNGGGSSSQQQQQQQQQQQPFLRIPGEHDAAKQNPAMVQAKKKVTKKKKSKQKKKEDCNGRSRRKPASDFYYYYSGFGPWWGRRRRDGDVDGGDECDAACDGAPPKPRVHDQGPDDLDDDDDDDDDDDVEDVREDDGGDDVVATSKRRRKPIKARSLKSLL